MAMSDDERDQLIDALGRANTALSLIQSVFQLLGERNLIPRAVLLEAVDQHMVIVEDFRPMIPDGDVQHQQMQLFMDNLRALPSFKPKPKA